MLFKRPEVVKPIRFAELERYIGSLFDSQVSNVINSVNKYISILITEASKFEELSEKFYSSDANPDIEFIEHMSYGFINSQKNLYSKSLSSILHKAQSSTQVVADTRYEEAKLKKEALESMIQEILKLNSKFSIILVGYPKQMDAFKRQFSRMEKPLKSINDQLKGMSHEVSTYNSLIERTAKMAEEIGMIDETGVKVDTPGTIRDESADEELRSAISSMESERSSYEVKKRSLEEEANSIRRDIASLLQPLSRTARIYDHESKSKVRMAEFIGNPINLLQNANDYHTFEAELLKMQAYILGNASKFKGHEADLNQIMAAIKSNIPSVLSGLRSLSGDIGATKDKIAALTARIHEMANERDKLEEKLGEMVDKEEKLSKSYESMLKYKGEIEKLCLDIYRVKIEVTDIPNSVQ